MSIFTKQYQERLKTSKEMLLSKVLARHSQMSVNNQQMTQKEEMQVLHQLLCSDPDNALILGQPSFELENKMENLKINAQPMEKPSENIEELEDFLEDLL